MEKLEAKGFLVFFILAAIVAKSMGEYFTLIGVALTVSFTVDFLYKDGSHFIPKKGRK